MYSPSDKKSKSDPPRSSDVKPDPKANTPAFVDKRPEVIAQLKLQEKANRFSEGKTIQAKKNNTGLPDKLKSGIENLSNQSMDDVKVHYNSAQPEQLNAHAYAQGSNIHLAPGQEKHLAHEAWHVVQQKQGRVKPTTQLKDKVNINDDTHLEKEADEMGNQALQASSTISQPLQRKTLGNGIVQRKVNPITNIFRTNYSRFLGIGGDPANVIDQEIHDYNQINQAHAKLHEYVTQIVDLETIQNHEVGAFHEVSQNLTAEKAQKERQKSSLEQKIIRDKAQLTLVKLRKAAYTQVGHKLVDNRKEKERLEADIVGDEIQVGHLDGVITALNQKITVSLAQEQGNFHTAVSQEIIGVRGQIQQNALQAKLPSIQKLGARFYQDRAPKKINTLIQKLHNAATSNEKLPIIMNLDKSIYDWKSTYTTGGHLRQKYQNTTEDYQSKLATIKLIEHQVQYTRNAVLRDVFGGGAGPAPAAKDSMVKSGLALGKDTMSTLATPARGSRFAGGAGSSTGLTGELKETGSIGLPGGWSKSFSPEMIGKISEGLNAGGAGANAIGQFFRMVEVADSWKTFKTNKTKINGLMLALNIGDVGATTAAEVTMAGDNITKLKDGKGLEDTTNWSEAAVVTTGLAQGIFALKNAALGLISLKKAYDRAGMDNEKMFSHGLLGGVSLAKAAVGAMRTAQSVYKIIHATVPAPLLHAIPFVSLALDLIELIEAIYRTVQGYRYQRAMTTRVESFERTHPRVMNHITHDDLTRTETRGVMALSLGLTRKDYRRFHPLVMNKIDNHVGAGPLTVDVDSAHHNQKTLLSQDIKDIKEYEYLSKMLEINQKRKMKGGLDAIKALVNMTGDILTLAHVAAIAGVALKGLTTAGTLTHSGSKFVQKLHRNHKRKKLDKSAVGGIGAFTSIEDYNDAIGGTGVIDKSSKQKQTEYFRHATYILDRFSNLAVLGHSDAAVNEAVKGFKDNKKLLKASGVDYYEFIKTPNIDEQVKLLIKAMKSGR